MIPSTEYSGATVIERIVAPRPIFSLLAEMFVERGDKSDWELLHDLHYKAENLPIGPRFWKLTLEGETIGVLVTANPKGLLKERHVAFPRIKPGSGDTKLTNTTRYQYINRNFRVVSRFVVDTMYRGIGAGYRMMNLVSRMEGNTFMEIQSSMSKFNLFGQKAGFRFVAPRNANKYQEGLKFFRGHFAASPQDFEAILVELDAKPTTEREILLQQCKDFYYRHSALEKTGSNRDKGQGRVDLMNARHIIRSLQQITLASPMYGVWINPERGIALPARVPLTAFDAQRANREIQVGGMIAVGEFSHTEKQSEIMRHILAAAPAVPITLAELRAKLSYKPSKQAVLCSLKFLEGYGFLTKELRGRKSMLLRPTAKAQITFKGAATPPELLSMIDA